MAEEAQELVVTNTGQPITIEIAPAETFEQAQEAVAVEIANQAVVLSLEEGE